MKIRINEFAIKWLERFKKENYNFYLIFDADEFPDDCKKLGFIMDCGYSFIDKYGEDVNTYIGLKRKIDNVYDIQILGFGIFSQWRYFNHWSYFHPDGEEIDWFILALTRLAELTK